MALNYIVQYLAVFLLSSNSLSLTQKSVTEWKSSSCKGNKIVITVVRNTVVRATIKVDGKPQILGTRSPLTPPFDTDDYVGGETHMPKMVKVGP